MLHFIAMIFAEHGAPKDKADREMRSYVSAIMSMQNDAREEVRKTSFDALQVLFQHTGRSFQGNTLRSSYRVRECEVCPWIQCEPSCASTGTCSDAGRHHPPDTDGHAEVDDAQASSKVVSEKGVH